MKKRISITVLVLVLLLSNNLYSQWSTDPTVNNPISTLISEQGSPAITTDGNDGAIIVWEDWRNGGNENHDVYAQRISSAGTVLWTIDGVPVCTEANTISNPTVISDGVGGAIIVWVDMRNNATTNYDIYAQRINSSGTILWATDGVVVCTEASSQYNPAIASDGSGGAIITWWDLRNGVFNADIYAQRINDDGSVAWTTDGVAVCTESTEQRYPTIQSDGNNGAIISWHDYTNNDIYAQRVNASGTTLWAAAGVEVCTQANTQFNPAMASDGNGGAIVSWWDNRNGNWDIFAQRIHSDGSSVWLSNGVAVCSQANDRQNPTMTSDGIGGAIVAWVDGRNGSGGGYSDIYAQRINSSGTIQWGTDAEISTNFAAQYLPVITNAGSGSAIVSWYDYRNNNNDIYAARALSDGALPEELTLFTVTTNQSIVEIQWKTATERNNYGFEIEKKWMNEELREMNWEKIGFVEGSGTNNAPKEYSFNDMSISSGKYSYRLKQIDRDGRIEYSQEVEITVGTVPLVFAFDQNYPNPFNPSTTMSFTLQQSGMTTLKIYDAIGREVAVLVNEVLDGGVYHHRIFDAGKLASGVYYARLSSGGTHLHTKLLLMK